MALAGTDGVTGVAHAGWRGVAAGVIEATVAAMEALGAIGIEAVIGPCIHAECYEFGPDELDFVAARLGDGVRATTAAGTPALDLPAAVRAALERAGVEKVDDAGVCTACSGDHFSWRARQERQRQATVIWRPAREAGPGWRPAREAGPGWRPAREAGPGWRPAREAGPGWQR